MERESKMYYEERLINGLMCWRGHPDGAWTVYTLEELSERYNSLNLHYSKVLGRLREVDPLEQPVRGVADA